MADSAGRAAEPPGAAHGGPAVRAVPNQKVIHRLVRLYVVGEPPREVASAWMRATARKANYLYPRTVAVCYFEPWV